jgi:hypothetical protein
VPRKLLTCFMHKIYFDQDVGFDRSKSSVRRAVLKVGKYPNLAAAWSAD